jgi:hypothetical protein
MRVWWSTVSKSLESSINKAAQWFLWSKQLNALSKRSVAAETVLLYDQV